MFGGPGPGLGDEGLDGVDPQAGAVESGRDRDRDGALAAAQVQESEAGLAGKAAAEDLDDEVGRSPDLPDVLEDVGEVGIEGGVGSVHRQDDAFLDRSPAGVDVDGHDTTII